MILGYKIKGLFSLSGMLDLEDNKPIFGMHNSTVFN
jgi:hypothetical protein